MNYVDGQIWYYSHNARPSLHMRRRRRPDAPGARLGPLRDVQSPERTKLNLTIPLFPTQFMISFREHRLV